MAAKVHNLGSGSLEKKPAGETQAEEKVRLEGEKPEPRTPEEQIAEDIRTTITLLNSEIEEAAQMKIQTELTTVDITNIDSKCTLLGYYVKISKIL